MDDIKLVLFIVILLATGPGSWQLADEGGKALASRRTTRRRWGWETWAFLVTGLSTAAIGVYAVLGVELRPCRRLDLALNHSNCPRVLKGHTGMVTSVAFSPDGRTLASGADDATVRFWQVSDGSLVRTLKGHRYWVGSVTFSPGDTLLAAGSFPTVRLWNVQDGTPLHILEGQGGHFSPDGAMVASMKGNKVLLWRVSDGTLLRTLTVPGNLEVQMDFTQEPVFAPDGRTLAMEGGRVVLLWPIEP